MGADTHIGPADYTVFTKIYDEFATSQRADVGIGPYKHAGRYGTNSRLEFTGFPVKLNRLPLYSVGIASA